MQAAKRAGHGKYDFWGVAPSDDPKHPWAGITRFKAGFGGDRLAAGGAWELPGNRFWYTLYRTAKLLRR
jgi:lipid II:glycine glycyltransferase (peptidoglycan interpeptide bridge formation enzyme)